MTVAALIVNVPTATAQLTQQQSQIASGIDEAVKALDSVPRLKKLSPQKKKQLVEFVIGNTLFVMAHELGHGLINEMNLPVLGREEDAANSFAVVTALKMGSWFSERVLLEAAKGWLLASKRDKKQGNALAFYDEHGLDLQRAYNVICFMVGSDPEKYKALAAETKLPEERQTGCVYEWKNTAWSWDEMLKKHLRSADQPKVAVKSSTRRTRNTQSRRRSCATWACSKPSLRMRRIVTHGPSRGRSRRAHADKRMPHGNRRTLTLCYELANEFIELFVGYSSKLPRKLRAAR